MQESYEFRIEWEEEAVGDSRVYASGPLYDRAGNFLGNFGYLPEYFPERGRYPTSFDMELVLSEAPRNVTQSVDQDVSTREFACRYKATNRDSYGFDDRDTGNNAGDIRANLDGHPEWLDDGETCFATITIRYDHEEKLEERSEEEITEYRSGYHEWLEEFKERHT